MSTAIHTPLQWAQRPTTVLITIPVPDAKNVDIKMHEDTLEVSLTSGDKKYSSNVTLFAQVVPEESSHVVRDRSIEIKLQKKDKSAEYWPRLTKDKVKNQHITIDWGRWKDEEEVAGKADDLGDFGGGGMDMQQLLSQMGGAGGGAGLPDFGQGKADSDDDEDEGAPPPLE